MKDVMKEFVIRTYGRTELAQLYSPELTRQSAFRRLDVWIRRYPGLLQQMYASGYRDKCRVYSPLVVQVIVNALGEP
jgi:hypothetical protein